MSNAGRILRADLTEGKVEKEPTSSYVRDYVGGLSIGTKIFWDGGVPPEITGTDPRNMLIFRHKGIGLKGLLMITKMNWACQIIKSGNGSDGIIINHW